MTTYGTNFCIDGTASASSEYYGNVASKAFDGLYGASNVWEAYPVSSAWLKYDLGIGVAKVIAQYKIYAFQGVYYPTAWTLEGSNNDSDWTVIDTQTGQSFGYGETRVFNSFSNSAAYRYYRLNITGLSTNDIILADVEMMEGFAPAEVTPPALQATAHLAGTPRWNQIYKVDSQLLSALAGLAGIPFSLWITPPVLQATAHLAGTPRLNQGFMVNPPALAALAGLSGIPGFLVSVESFPLSCLAGLSSGKVSSFKNTSDYIIAYICRLYPKFGSAFLTLPMSSFQGRFKSGDPSYLSVVVPGLDFAQEISNLLNSVDRTSYLALTNSGNVSPGGSLVVATPGIVPIFPELSVYIVKTFSDGNQIMEQLMAVTLEKIDTYEGAINQSITLDGHRTKTYTPKIVTLTGASYRNTTDGELRYRCATDLYLRPGDTVNINGETFTADDISIAISPDLETFEFAQGIPSGGQMNPILLLGGGSGG